MSLGLSIGLSLGGRRGGGASPSPVEQINAAVFGADELGFHYDLQVAGSLYQTETTASPVTDASQVLGRVEDQSPNGWHLTQSSAALRPGQGTDADGRRVIAWDALDDFMVRSGPNAGDGIKTLVMAYDPAALRATGMLIGGPAGSGWAGCFNAAGGVGIVEGPQTIEGLWVGETATGLLAGGSRLAFRNALLGGSVVFLEWSGAPFGGNDQFNRLGLYSGGGFTTSNFSRALLINRALTAGERTLITGLWGLS